jgi:hypothetical protein
MKIRWGIPGTKAPYKCDLLELINSKAPRTLSEVVISYYFIPEEVAVKIVAAIREEDMKTGDESERFISHAMLFDMLRRVAPADIHWHAKVQASFPRLLSSRNPLGKIFAWFAPTITWGDYAKKVWPECDINAFINTYNGLTAKVEKHFLAFTAMQTS